MIKTIKIIMMLSLMGFLVGCQISYDLVIDENLAIEESITGFESNSILEQNGRTKEEEINYIISTLKQVGELGFYTKSPIYYSHSAGVKVSHLFNSYDDYLNTSPLKAIIFSNFNIKKESDKITIKTKASYIQQVTDDTSLSLNIININIPYPVIKHNADSNSGNTYTWQLLKNKPKKDIELIYATTLDYTPKKTNPILKKKVDNRAGLGILILISLGSIVGGIWFFFHQHKRRNSI